jgi:predicted phosphohydrolase
MASDSPREIRLDPKQGQFAVVSDLQRTSRAELWRESNRDEREAIMGRIASDTPDFVALLGDLVFRGSSQKDWRQFDELCRPLTAPDLPLFPILGNHEYWISRRAGVANYFSRFRHLQGKHWYTLRYGPLALVAVDSNIRWLPRARWFAQRTWYETELARLEQDWSVRGVLVLVHHPPYTNSTVTSDEIHVQHTFVPAFASSRKTMAMLSGHVHSYERFARSGKLFVVTGGGGGPRIKLARAGRRMRHADDLFTGPSVRLFHFLRFRLREDGLEADAIGLEKGGRAFQTMDRFLLSYAAVEATSEVR